VSWASSIPQTRLDVTHLPNDEIVFAGEREDLEEIVGNLLENAMKWGPQTVSIGAVDTATHRKKAGHRSLQPWSIEDDGPGIPEEKARDALVAGPAAGRDETRNGPRARHRR
jgi:signal transduction histidine kinase